MLGHFGFSYVGVLYLLMLFLPNIIWIKNKPEGYSSEGENRILGIFEIPGRCWQYVLRSFFLILTSGRNSPGYCG